MGTAHGSRAQCLWGLQGRQRSGLLAERGPDRARGQERRSLGSWVEVGEGLRARWLARGPVGHGALLCSNGAEGEARRYPSGLSERFLRHPLPPWLPFAFEAHGRLARSPQLPCRCLGYTPGDGARLCSPSLGFVRHRRAQLERVPGARSPQARGHMRATPASSTRARPPSCTSSTLSSGSRGSAPGPQCRARGP